MSVRTFCRSLSGLLGVGLVMVGEPSFLTAGEPGTITPRVPLRVAVQDDADADAPVPDAALEAPGEDDEGEPTAAGSPAQPARPAPAGTTIAPRITRDDYRMAYYAVPFSLAEYQANPGYRHAAAMKFLTGEYPPAAPPTPVAPAPGFDGFGFGGLGFGGFDGFGAGLPFNAPARGFPGLAIPGGWSGPPTFGPPPFAFDRVQGVIPTFVNRYQTPRVFLPGR